MNASVALSLTDVTKTFGGLCAVDRVSFTVRAGALSAWMVALTG